MEEHNQGSAVIAGQRENFVMGLHWQILPSDALRRKKKAAKQAGYDHYLVTEKKAGNEKKTLYGVINTALLDAHKKHPLISLAAALQPAFSHNVCAVFRIAENHYWFLACIDGMISPLSDMTGNETDIKNALTNFIALHPVTGETWQRIAPDGFIDETFSEARLDDYLADLKNTRYARLRPLQSKKGAVFWLLAILLVVSGYTGNRYYQDAQMQKKIADAQQALAIRKAELLSRQGDKLKPWGKQVRLSDFLDRCHTQWQQAPLSVAGWLFKSARCESKDARSGIALTLRYTMGSGSTVDDFTRRLPDWYGGHLRSEFNIPGAGNVATLHLDAQPVSANTPEALPDFDTLTQHLTSYAQKIGAQLRLVEQSSDWRDEGGNVIPMPWRKIRFTFITDIPPSILFLDSHYNSDGMRGDNVAMDLSGARLKYTLEGDMYATK